MLLTPRAMVGRIVMLETLHHVIMVGREALGSKARLNERKRLSNVVFDMALIELKTTLIPGSIRRGEV